MPKVFELEGPNGICQLWRDEYGYQLYFESCERNGGKPLVMATWPIFPDDSPIFYSNPDEAEREAFEDAKTFCGLDDWNMSWLDICLHQYIDDWDEWNDFISTCERALNNA